MVPVGIMVLYTYTRSLHTYCLLLSFVSLSHTLHLIQRGGVGSVFVWKSFIWWRLRVNELVDLFYLVTKYNLTPHLNNSNIKIHWVFWGNRNLFYALS